jgi:hypothetical protein
MIIIAVGTIWLIVPGETGSIKSLFDNRFVIPERTGDRLELQETASGLASEWNISFSGIETATSFVKFYHTKEKVCILPYNGALRTGPCHNFYPANLFMYSRKDKCIATIHLGQFLCVKNGGNFLELQGCPAECFNLLPGKEPDSQFRFELSGISGESV